MMICPLVVLVQRMGRGGAGGSDDGAGEVSIFPQQEPGTRRDS